MLAVSGVDRLLIGPQGVYFSSLCYARTGYKQLRVLRVDQERQ